MRFPRKGTFFSILKSEKSKKIVKKNVPLRGKQSKLIKK